MVHEMIDGTYRQTNLPNESPEYLSKREELRLAEIELLNNVKESPRCGEACRKVRRFRITSFLKAQRLSTMAMRRYKNRTVERPVHWPGSFARDLSLHVWKEANRTVPDVYRLDR